MTAPRRALIIGGGFFGCRLAVTLAQRGMQVRLLEAGGQLLGRASYVNQARVHNGYHYPRSLLTALRSRVNFPRFVEEYADCVKSDFQKYYAVGRVLSKVSAAQFLRFMQRIGAPIKPAPSAVKRWFNAQLIEEVFEVTEYAFDAVLLAARCQRELSAAGITPELHCRAHSIRRKGETLLLRYTRGSADTSSTASSATEEEAEAELVFNCTYSHLNELLHQSGLALLDLKQELTEMALIEPPAELKQVGITLMCGPFFSCMPFPPRNLHTLSHVRYTPHFHWRDKDRPGTIPSEVLATYHRQTHYPQMLRDAQRYLPLLAQSQYRDSLWEIKTVLPQSEQDDSRPILLRQHEQMPGLYCVMGGKIDNVYDVADEIQDLLSPTPASTPHTALS